MLLFGAVQAAIPRVECSTYEGLVPVRQSGNPFLPSTPFRFHPPGVPRTPDPTPEMTMGTRRDCQSVRANTTLAVILATFGLASVWYATKV